MADFKGRKVLPVGGATLDILTYENRQYLRTTAIGGTPTTYKWLGAGENITVSASQETIKHQEEFHVSDEHYIQDQLGNKYHLAFLPIYDIDETDGNGKPSLVGRAPGGKFGGK